MGIVHDLNKLLGLCCHLKPVQDGKVLQFSYSWLFLQPKSCFVIVVTSLQPLSHLLFFLRSIQKKIKEVRLRGLSLGILINFFNLHLYSFQLLWKWKQNRTAQCSLYLLICPCCLSYLPFLFSGVCCCSIFLGFFLTTFPGCLGVSFAVISLLHLILCENLFWRFFTSHSGFS